LECDFAIVGVGIYPATLLAEAAGVACENGITTDAHGQTSVPHIWAAGDCATLDWNGSAIRLESVGNAIDQAENVARNMLGANVPYQPKPWFWSDQYDCKLQIAGLNSGYTQVITRGSGDAQSHWYYRDDTLLAVDAMNDPRSYMIGKRLIEAGKSPAPSVVADPETDMKALLKA
jgi:3-phenylpropionate/trans-cinnamate dioxygenase ferredoxin reductase subunit